MIKNKFFTALMFTTAISTLAFASDGVPLLADPSGESSIKASLTVKFNEEASSTNTETARDQLVAEATKLIIEQQELASFIDSAKLFFAHLADPSDPINFSADTTLLETLTKMFSSARSLDADVKLMETKISNLESDLDAAKLEAARVIDLERDLKLAQTEASRVTYLTSQVSLLTPEASKAATLLNNQALLQARILELEGQISSAGILVRGTAPVITPLAPILLTALTISVPTVEYTLSDRSTKVNLTEKHISILRAEQKKIVGTGRGSAAKHAAIDSKDHVQLVSEFADETIKEIASIS